MTDAQEKILNETHGSTQRIVGILTGGNGGGLVREVQQIEERIKWLEGNTVTGAQCAATHASLAKAATLIIKRRRSAWLWVKDAVLLLLAIGGFLYGSGVLR